MEKVKKDEKKEKKILVIVSGVFLLLIILLLFITLQSRDNMISNHGMYSGSDAQLGDTTCGNWRVISSYASTGISGCSATLPNDNTTESGCVYRYEDDPDECYSGSQGTIVSDSCYIITNYSRTCETTVRDAVVGTCKNPTYTGETTLEIATEGTYTTSTGRYQLNVGSYDVFYNAIDGHAFSDGSKVQSIRCSIKSPTYATLTCLSVAYDGEEHTIATCNDYCGIDEVNGESADFSSYDATDVGNYYITATASGSVTFSNGSQSATCTAKILGGNISNLAGNTVIAISGGETVVGTYNATNSSGTGAGVTGWSKSGNNMTPGDDCVENSSTCHITYSNETACTQKKVTVIASDEAGEKSLNVTVYHYNAWSGPYNVGPVDTPITGQTKADMKYKEGCEAYENWQQDSVTSKWSGKAYYRCCGTSPFVTSPTAPPTTAPTAPPTTNPTTAPTKCYIKRGNGTNNEYCRNTASYCEARGFSEIVSDADCNKAAACYLRESDNEYVVGEFSGQTGYTYYGSECPTPACYKKPNDAYIWTNKPEDGYELIQNITNQTDCNPACYIDKNGQYYWGLYSNNSNYTLVPNKTETTCKDVLPQVPKTSLSVDSFAYIIIFISGFAGIGLITYTVLKKKSI